MVWDRSISCDVHLPVSCDVHLPGIPNFGAV